MCDGTTSLRLKLPLSFSNVATRADDVFINALIY